MGFLGKKWYRRKESNRFTNPNLMKTVNVDFTSRQVNYDIEGKRWYSDGSGTLYNVTTTGAVYRQDGTLMGGVNQQYYTNPNTLVGDY